MDVKKFFRRVLAALLIGLCELTSSVVSAEEDFCAKSLDLNA